MPKVSGVYCDVCGKSTRWDERSSGTEEYAYIGVNGGRWGYGSRFDGEEHSLIICADCYEKMPEPWRSKVLREPGSSWWNQPCVGLDTIPEDTQTAVNYRDQDKREALIEAARSFVGVMAGTDSSYIEGYRQRLQDALDAIVGDDKKVG